MVNQRQRVRRFVAAAVLFAALALPAAAFAGPHPATLGGLAQVPAPANTDALGHLNLSDSDIGVIVDHTIMPPSQSTYRYADSVLNPPTITSDGSPDLGFLDVDTLSFGSVTWPPGMVPEGLGEPGHGRFLPTGDGIVADRDYLVGTVDLGAPLPEGPIAGIESKNFGFALHARGLPGWQQLEGVFDFDTWQGACCILWASYFPSPWAANITTIGADNSINDRTDVNGFTFTYHDIVIFGADRQQLLGDGPPDMLQIRYYSHFSDSALGSNPSSISNILTVPAIDGSNKFLEPFLFDITVGQTPDPVEVDSGAGVDDDDLLGSPDDDLLGEGQDDGSDASDAVGTEADDTPSGDDSTVVTPLPDPASPGSSPGDGGSRWPWAVGAGGMVLIGGGELVRRRGRDSTLRTDPNDDNFLFEALAGLGGTTSSTEMTSADADHLWTIALAPELTAQADIARAQAEIVRRWTEWHSRFKEALVRFAESYLRAWQGSDALRANQADWRVHQVGAKAADLAVALIQLVRGVFMLGRGIAGWYRARQAAQMAARSADEVLALRTAAQEAIDASPQLSRFADEFMGQGRAGMKSYRDELVDVVMWGQDAGVDVVSILAARLDDMAGLPVGKFRKLDVLIEGVIPQIMRAAGLVEAAPAVANAVENTAGVVRVLATEGAALSDEGAASIRAFVQMVDDTPGFFDDAGNMFVKLARGTDDMLTGEVAQLANPDRLSGLRSLYDAVKAADGDLGRVPQLFRDAVGPAKATVLANGGGATSAIPSALMQDGAITAAHGTTMAATDGASGDAPVQVGLGSVDAQMHQYGITGDSFGGNVWDLITAPIETTTGIYHSWGALDEIEDIFDANAEDLSEMSSAWTQLTNSLGGLENFSEGGAAGRDPIDGLRSALHDLERAQQGLRDVGDNAPQDWQDANRQRFDDKMAHIDQKKATIQRLIDGLQRLKVSIGRLKEQLEALEQTPDGNRRTSLEWIDPALSEGLTQVAFQLEAIGHEILAIE